MGKGATNEERKSNGELRSKWGKGRKWGEKDGMAIGGTNGERGEVRRGEEWREEEQTGRGTIERGRAIWGKGRKWGMRKKLGEEEQYKESWKWGEEEKIRKGGNRESFFLFLYPVLLNMRQYPFISSVLSCNWYSTLPRYCS